MSDPIPADVKNHVALLQKDANNCLRVHLNDILAPAFEPKARQCVDAILTLVRPLNDVFKSSKAIHYTALDTGLQNLQAVEKALASHYTDKEHEAALRQHQLSFKKVVEDIKMLRKEIPQEAPPAAQTTSPTPQK